MRADDSALLLSLYRSPQDAQAFAGYLGALAQRTGAKSAHLVLQDAGGTEIFGQGEVALSADLRLRMRYLRVYSGDDFAAPMPFRALRTRVEGGGDAWAILGREGADFAASTSLLLDGLAPHLAQVAAQFWEHRRSLARAAAAQNMGARLGLTCALLGAEGQPLGGEKLPLPAALQRQIAQRVADYAQKKSAAAWAMTQGETQVFLAPYAGSEAVAILCVQLEKDKFKNAASLLQGLFGLSKTEARFAAEMAGGKSIAEAGEALNFTLETARYYSKQIYAKLGVVGQAGLIRTIERSVFRLL